MCRLALVALLTVALAGVACGSSTAPTAVRTTETFSGTVAVNGFRFHVFNVTNGGTVDLTFTAAGPPSTIVMGIGIGLPANGTNGGTCASSQNGSAVVTSAGTTPQLTGQASPGPLCAEVYDVGNQTNSVSYTLVVVHP